MNCERILANSKIPRALPLANRPQESGPSDLTKGVFEAKKGQKGGGCELQQIPNL
jgi:hypothetical protein